MPTAWRLLSLEEVLNPLFMTDKTVKRWTGEGSLIFYLSINGKFYYY